jgi:DNA-binding response OmpR family regulator
MNILVVDNCECLRSFCTYALEDEGHKVFPAMEDSYFDYFLENGFHVDLVIINANPGDPSPAREIVSITRNINPEIPILILTTSWHNTTLKGLLDLGCEPLTIPFEYGQFIDKVNSISAAACPIC